VLTDRIVAAVIIAVGGSKETTMPDMDTATSELDEFLASEPETVNVDDIELLRALKIRR